MKRNLEAERLGTRYGKRTVVGIETMIISGTKFVGLWLQCDCGDRQLVAKHDAKRRHACRECGYDAMANGLVAYHQRRKCHESI